MSLADGFLGSVSSDQVKLNEGLRDIDHSSDLVVFFGFVAHVDGLVLLANRAIVSVVADAVAMLEGKLLLLVLISDDSDYDVVVLDVDDLDVEVELALLGNWLIVEQLVGRTMQFLHIVVVDAEFAVMLALLVHLEDYLLAELFKVLGFL